MKKHSNLRAYLFYSFILCCFLYVAAKKTIENYKLKKEGICTKAYVYRKTKVGGKGKIRTRYQFKHNGNYYYDFSFSDDYAQIGDSITIVYLESDPEISRSNSFLEKKCLCDSVE